MSNSTWPFGDAKPLRTKNAPKKRYENRIDNFEDIRFEPVSILVELFPAPLSTTDPFGRPYECAEDLLMMSGHYGYSELFVPLTSNVLGISAGREISFSRFEFLSWQLLNASNETLYWLANKTEANLEDIFDFDDEFRKNEAYAPSSWFNASNVNSEEFRNGLELIGRMKLEAPTELCEILVEAICDRSTGVVEWLETEVESNIDEVAHAYRYWAVPLMVVSKGSFPTYIEHNSRSLMRDEWQLNSMYIRNYDEGDVM